MNTTTFPIQFDATFGIELPASDKLDPAELVKDLLEVVSESQRTAETDETIEADETLTVEPDETLQAKQFLAAGEVLNAGSLEAGVPPLPHPWRSEPPKVHLLQETRQAERGPGHNQPAEIYVWSDTTDLSRFSADGDHLNQSGDVEVFIVTLEDGKLGVDNKQYRQDVVQFFSEYLNDNEANTPFHRIEPSAVDDQRAEHITGTTDHHASVVTISLDHFRPTGVGSL